MVSPIIIYFSLFVPSNMYDMILFGSICILLRRREGGGPLLLRIVEEGVSPQQTQDVLGRGENEKMSSLAN